MESSRILVVDDDAAVAEAVKAALEGVGQEVDTVSDGQAALEWLSREPLPDVILLDLMMPRMDGWSFRLAQRKDPLLCDIPVLAMSANTSSEAEAIDADGFLRKPFTRSELLRDLQQLLARARERRSHAEHLATSERLVALGHLAAGIAHEVNNPLAYVTSNISAVTFAVRRMADELRTLRAGGAPDPASAVGEAELEDLDAALSDSLEGLARIATIVAEVKTLSRAPTEETQAVAVAQVLDSVARVADARVRARGRLIQDYGRSAHVQAVPGRLTQVLLNLLLNAADALPEPYSEKNRVRIQVTEGVTEVRIDVADNGRGIAPEVQAQLFRPFFTTKPAGQGTGLGLYVSRQLIEAMHGRLEVRAGAGETVFSVTLPRTHGVEGQAPEEATALSRHRILLVDDEPALVRAMERELGGHHEVISVASGAAALERLATDDRFDLVLCDLHMRGVSGREVFERVCRDRPALAARFAFITAGAVTRAGQTFLNAVDRPVLLKPVGLREVEQLLSRAEERVPPGQ